VTEYLVKLAFWLRAYDSVTIEATADGDAIETATAAAKATMQSRATPESIDTDHRRQGVIAYVDRLDPDRRESVIENVAFDCDHVLGPLHDFVRRVAALPAEQPIETFDSLDGASLWCALIDEARRLIGDGP
jgi:hypothetical protein